MEGGEEKMNEKIDLEKVKRWLRARAGTIEKKEHLIEILKERFDNPEEVLTLLTKKGLAKDVGNDWIDLINLFKGIYVGEYEEEEE
jgi:hypothetical protein